MCHYAAQANYELPFWHFFKLMVSASPLACAIMLTKPTTSCHSWLFFQALIAAMWLLVLAATLALAILLSKANARYLQIAPVSISSEATLNVAARKTPVIIFTTAKFTNVT